jgi:hypothetical protein
MNQVAQTTEAKSVIAPRVSLTLKHGSTEHKLLKYPFPVKAAKFPVKVNGAEVQAATTSGKGKDYTYILINNTSFYVPGILPVDADLKVNFPEGYKFDEVQAPRVSTYKPKKKAAATAENGADGKPAAEAGAGTPAPDAAQPAEGGKRRKG